MFSKLHLEYRPLLTSCMFQCLSIGLSRHTHTHTHTTLELIFFSRRLFTKKNSLRERFHGCYLRSDGGSFMICTFCAKFRSKFVSVIREPEIGEMSTRLLHYMYINRHSTFHCQLPPNEKPITIT